MFDVFGTVVDWRGSIVREGEALSAAKGLRVDWPAFADAWRAGYQPAMQRARSGADRLDETSTGCTAPSSTRCRRASASSRSTEPERERLNRVWHRLDPWPDVVAGLQRLKQRFTIATLSNGNVSLLVDMAKPAGLPWDCVLSAELFRHYKPDPEVYLGAARLLGVAPAELLMVAAHPSDLAAAAEAGLRTAYVPRPLEHGAGGGLRDAPTDRRFDHVATDFADLAARLGACRIAPSPSRCSTLAR